MDRKHGDRVRRLQRLAVVPGALIFYESPHRIVATLEAVAEVFPQREVAVCRELTKLHEEVLRGPAAQLAEELCARGEVKGEIALVIAPPSEDEESGIVPVGDAAVDPDEACARTFAPRSRRGSPPLRWPSACLRSIRAASAMSMPWCSICNRWRISSPCARIIPCMQRFSGGQTPWIKASLRSLSRRPSTTSTPIRTWHGLFHHHRRRSGSLSPLHRL